MWRFQVKLFLSYMSRSLSDGRTTTNDEVMALGGNAIVAFRLKTVRNRPYVSMGSNMGELMGALPNAPVPDLLLPQTPKSPNWVLKTPLSDFSQTVQDGQHCQQSALEKISTGNEVMP